MLNFISYVLSFLNLFVFFYFHYICLFFKKPYRAQVLDYCECNILHWIKNQFKQHGSKTHKYGVLS